MWAMIEKLRIRSMATAEYGGRRRAEPVQPGQDAAFPQVGVAADGDAVFTWVRAPSEGVQAWAGP